MAHEEPIMEERKDVTPENGKKKALAKTEAVVALTYGARSEVRELAERIKVGLPGMSKVPAEVIAGFAQYALAHDLDPWNGEIWLIVNEKKKETSVMAGIKGIRKAARRQLPDRHHYNTNFRPIQPGTPEWSEYGLDIPDQYNNAVLKAELCILRRSDATAVYIEQLDKMRQITGAYEEAKAVIGDAPVFIGLGVVRAGDKSRMEFGQLVKKRAESDALKQAFDLPFASYDGNGDTTRAGYQDPDEAIEGHAYEVPDDPDDRDPTPTDPADKPEVIEAEVATDTPAETPGTAPETPEATEPVAESTQAPETPETATPAVRTGKPKAVKDVTRATLIDQLKTRTPVTFQEAAELLNTTLKTEYEPKGYYLSIIKSLRARRDDLSADTPPAIADVWPDLIALAASA